MELYSLLRHLADSWALLLMTLLFLGMIVWVMRPAGRRLHDQAAMSIFENEDRPARGSAIRDTAKEPQP